MRHVNRLLTSNANIETIKSILNDEHWTHFMWGVDPSQTIDTCGMMNEMHLLFLLLARFQVMFINPVSLTLLGNETFYLYAKRTEHLTLREIFDVIQNLQLHWHIVIDTVCPSVLEMVLDGCMARFGKLAGCTHSADVLDHLEYSETFGSCRRITTSSIRHACAFFLAAYRHLHLHTCAILLPSLTSDCDLLHHEHLRAASLDDFYRLSMVYDLCIGNIIHYEHEFTGMYHSATQVMYYNNPTYIRRKQLDLAEIMHASAEHGLPLALQLYPDVKVVFEDSPGFFMEPLQNDEHVKHPLPTTTKGWRWLLLSRSLYLVTNHGHVFHAKTISPLVALLHTHLACTRLA